MSDETNTEIDEVETETTTQEPEQHAEPEPPKPNRFQRRLARARGDAASEREKRLAAEAKLANLTKADPAAGGPQMGAFENFDDYETAKKAWEARPIEQRSPADTGRSVEQSAAEFVAQLDEWDDAPEGAIDKIRSQSWEPTPTMVTTMIDLDNGPETALWLAEHPKTVKRLSAMDSKQQERELWKISTRIEDNGKLKPAVSASPKGNALNAPTGPSDGKPADASKMDFEDYERSRRESSGGGAGRGNW